MRQIIIDLTNKGIIQAGEFLGIQFDPRHQNFEVWCGQIKRFKREEAAKQFLSKIVPGFENLDTTGKIEDEEDFLWLDRS